MLKLALAFVFALLAAVLGLGGIYGALDPAMQFTFWLFVIVALVTFSTLLAYRQSRSS